MSIDVTWVSANGWRHKRVIACKQVTLTQVREYEQTTHLAIVLAAPQFIHKYHGHVALEQVQSMDIGQKDAHRSLFYVWQEIFQLPKPKRRRLAANAGSRGARNGVLENGLFPALDAGQSLPDKQEMSTTQSRFHNILRSAMSAGEYDKVGQGESWTTTTITITRLHNHENHHNNHHHNHHNNHHENHHNHEPQLAITTTANNTTTTKTTTRTTTRTTTCHHQPPPPPPPTTTRTTTTAQPPPERQQEQPQRRWQQYAPFLQEHICDDISVIWYTGTWPPETFCLRQDSLRITFKWSSKTTSLKRWGSTRPVDTHKQTKTITKKPINIPAWWKQHQAITFLRDSLRLLRFALWTVDLTSCIGNETLNCPI